MKKNNVTKKTSKKAISSIGSDFYEHLELELTNPQNAAEFINAAVEMNDPEYLKVALGRVAKVRGIKEIANTTNLGRESIYKMFAQDSNPALASIQSILDACGLELVVRSKNAPMEIPMASALRKIVKREVKGAVKEALETRVTMAAAKYSKKSESSTSHSRPVKATSTLKRSTKKAASY